MWSLNINTGFVTSFLHRRNYFIAAILFTNIYSWSWSTDYYLHSMPRICNEVMVEFIHSPRINVGSIWSCITSSRARYFARRKMYCSHCSCSCLSYSNWIRHNSCRSKFGRYSSSEVSMFSCNVTSNCIVSCKCSRAVGTWYSNALMALTNMRS